MKKLLCLAVILAPLAAVAQDAAPDLKHAIIVARGGTIAITRLPIKTATGTVYRDVTIELHADSSGHITLVNATPAPGAGREVALATHDSGTPAPVELPQKPSAPINMQRFTAGTYSGRDGSLVQLRDLGVDVVHHVPMWSITSTDGNGSLQSVIFYSGPPFMNPKSKRLARAQITGETYAYGTADSGSSGAFQTGALIGVVQQGTQLRVVSFRHGCCTDTETPVAELDYSFVGR